MTKVDSDMQYQNSKNYISFVNELAQICDKSANTLKEVLGIQFKEKLQDLILDMTTDYKNYQEKTTKAFRMTLVKHLNEDKAASKEQTKSKLINLKNKYDDIKKANLVDEHIREGDPAFPLAFQIKHQLRQEIKENFALTHSYGTNLGQKLSEFHEQTNAFIVNTEASCLKALLIANPFETISDVLTDDKNSFGEEPYKEIKNLFANYDKQEEFEFYEKTCKLQATLKKNMYNTHKYLERQLDRLKLTNCPAEIIKQKQNNLEKLKTKSGENLAKYKFNKFFAQLNELYPKNSQPSFKSKQMERLVCKLKEITHEAYLKLDNGSGPVYNNTHYGFFPGMAEEITTTTTKSQQTAKVKGVN
jgi:hypothetical protein